MNLATCFGYTDKRSKQSVIFYFTLNIYINTVRGGSPSVRCSVRQKGRFRTPRLQHKPNLKNIPIVLLLPR